MSITPELSTSAPPVREPRPSGLVDVVAVWQLLKRRALLILGVTVLAFAAVVGWLALATPRYTATAVLIVDPRQQRVLQSEAVLSGIGSDAAAVESQVEVIQSSAVAEKVIGSLHLADDPEFTRPGTLASLLAKVRGEAPPPSPDDRRVLDRFEERLKVSRRGLTYVLEIRFTSDDPGKAARIANAVAETYIADQVDAKNDANLRAASLINERLGDIRKRASAADQAVAAFKGANNIVDTGEGRTLVERQISELNQQLILARARTAEAKARLDQVAKANVATVGSGSIPEALASPVIANLRGQYAEAARREADTLSTYGPRHPSVSAMRAQMGDVRAQIEREIGRVSAGIRNEYEVARSRERSLEASLAELKTQAGAVDQATVKLRALEQEAQASRTLLNQALLRFRETSEQEGLQRSDARILSPAVAPLRPSEPKVPLVLLVGGVGALLLGIGSAVMAESLARGLRTTRDVEDALALPVLGLVPQIDPASVRKARRRTGAGKGDGSRRDLPDPARGISRFSVDQPLSPFGEAMRALRSRLLVSGLERPAVLAVLSSGPNEGKSTLASNLAHSFAKSGTRTILVDTDVRKPAVSPGIWQDGPGLAQLLSNPRREEAKPIVDPVSGLHVLPLGPAPDVAALSEALGSPALALVLGRLKGSYDVVVLDGPPLLPVADGRYVLQAADLAVLAVEWGRTDPDAAASALESLGPAAQKIAGVVLTKVDLPRSGFAAYGKPYGAAAAAAAA